MPTMRSYQDGCAAAHALDIVGERWALLVIRELILGPKRFTDLRIGLPKASPNVLSQRLRELEDNGVVRKRRLPPPAASRVYELTEWGADLEPILAALGRWGVHSSAMPFATAIGTDSLVVALRAMFDAEAAREVSMTVQLWFGHDHFTVTVEDQRLDVNRGDFDAPGTTIETDADTLKQVALGKAPAQPFMDSGHLTIYGRRAEAERFFTLFRLPINQSA